MNEGVAAEKERKNGPRRGKFLKPGVKTPGMEIKQNINSPESMKKPVNKKIPLVKKTSFLTARPQCYAQEVVTDSYMRSFFFVTP